MVKIERIYQCDNCSTKVNSIDLVHVELSHPEIYDEGELNEKFDSFDVCNRCAKIFTLEQLSTSIQNQSNGRNKNEVTKH